MPMPTALKEFLQRAFLAKDVEAIKMVYRSYWWLKEMNFK